ncbi:hypothetical protein Tco_0271944 [Tanacetum coccineum]
MACPVEGGGTEDTNDREETLPPSMKEQIKGHVSALKSLIKITIKETREIPFAWILNWKTRKCRTMALLREMRSLKSLRQRGQLGRIALPVWCRMFQQTLDGSARGWFERLPRDNINEWADLREAFATRCFVRMACFKEPHEITKMGRKDNESLIAFKERWTVETGFIMDVPEVMKISSSFIGSGQSPETGQTFFRTQVFPITVNEIMERLDDFVDLKKHIRKDNRSYRNTHPGDLRRNDYRNNYRGRDAYLVSRTRDYKAPYPPSRGEYNKSVHSSAHP